MYPPILGLLFFFCAQPSPRAWAGAAPASPTPPSEPRVVSLAEALRLATSQGSDFLVKRTEIAKAEARTDQAHAASYPKVIGSGILSPIFESRGNAQQSVDDTSRWGAWLQGTVTILQPIYSFGRLSSFREAADAGLGVARAQVRKDENEIRYSTKELYYSTILAETLYQFLLEGEEDIAKVVKKAEEDQQKRSPEIKKRDFFRLKIFHSEARFRLEEAKKLRMLARHALSFALGFSPDEETIPQETSLLPIDFAPPSETALLPRLLEQRPEFQMLSQGIRAKTALLSAEAANKYPMVFAGGLLSFAYSNVRDRQQSAYAFDPYNRQTGGVGVGVQWSWDFATTLANESAIRAEIDELEKKSAFARSGVRLELKKALADLAEARSRLEGAKDAYQVGKRWLVSESMGYSTGLGDVKNLVDAYLARAKTAKDHWEAIYRVNMAWANLSKTVGEECSPDLAARQ